MVPNPDVFKDTTLHYTLYRYIAGDCSRGFHRNNADTWLQPEYSNSTQQTRGNTVLAKHVTARQTDRGNQTDGAHVRQADRTTEYFFGLEDDPIVRTKQMERPSTNSRAIIKNNAQ